MSSNRYLVASRLRKPLEKLIAYLIKNKQQSNNKETVLSWGTRVKPVTATTQHQQLQRRGNVLHQRMRWTTEKQVEVVAVVVGVV